MMLHHPRLIKLLKDAGDNIRLVGLRNNGVRTAVGNIVSIDTG